MLTQSYKVLIGSKSMRVEGIGSCQQDSIMTKLITCMEDDPAFFSPIKRLTDHRYIGFRLEGCSIVFHRELADMPYGSMSEWPQCRWMLADRILGGIATVLVDSEGKEIVLDTNKPVYKELVEACRVRPAKIV